MQNKASRQICQKRFRSSDVFFNNGIVNIFGLLKELEEDGKSGIESVELKPDEMVLRYYGDRENELYSTLLQRFIYNNNIVYQTDNKRLYWDKNSDNFIIDYKFDVKGKTSGNDVKYLYKYISADEIGLDTKSLYEQFLQYTEKYMVENSIKTESRKIFYDGNQLKKSNKVNIPLYMDLDEAVNNFAQYMAGDRTLKMDSKIHQFEDGGSLFRDMLVNKDNTIDRWDALIYWYGVRTKRFYNVNCFIYPHSHNLKALMLLKGSLNIIDNPIEYSEGEGKPNKKLPTNIDFVSELPRDGIRVNRNFYMSRSPHEFELKLLMYIFTYISNIENDYIRMQRIQQFSQKKDYAGYLVEKIFNHMLDIKFIMYTDDDGNMKSSLNEYSKTYKLFKLFNELKERNLYSSIADMITTVALSKAKGEENRNIGEMCDNILNFRSIRKNCFIAVFDILKNQKNGFGQKLFYFLQEYINFIEGRDIEMSVHEKAKAIGDTIGRFCAETKNNNILFKLRNVKNSNQLIEFFKDYEFTVLKNQVKDITPIAKNFSDNLNTLLELMEAERECWQIARDYIAIYAINCFRYLTWKNQNRKENE